MPSTLRYFRRQGHERQDQRYANRAAQALPLQRYVVASRLGTYFLPLHTRMDKPKAVKLARLIYTLLTKGKGGTLAGRPATEGSWL